MKKLLSIILAAALMLAVLPVGVVSANVVAPMQASCDRMIRNDNYEGVFCGETVKAGTQNTLYVQNIVYGGTPLSVEDVAFEWYKNGSNNQQNEIISGEDGFSYTFTATVSSIYTCMMYFDGMRIGVSVFVLSVDTISVTPVSSHTVEADEDWQDSFFYVYDCEQSTDISVGVNAASAVDGATLTYKWALFDPWTGEETPLSDTQNNITVKKGKGNEYYTCKISDGSYTKQVEFLLCPVDTLTETIKINGVTPKRFERGHMAVAKVGDEVTFEVKTTSTNGEVSYRWEQWDEYFDEETGWHQEMTLLGTTDTVTVTKREIEGDPYGFERFECYIDDGNEVIDIGFVLFLLDPNQVTTEEKIAENTPSVSLDNTTEDLANSVLQENMEELSFRETAKITLTAEAVEELTGNEQSAVDKVISENDNIGACLDINLYKEISEDNSQITETAGEIDLSIEVPSDLRNSEYDYQVVRIHEGKAEVLDCEYNAETGEVSFATDKFSTYVLTYASQAHEHSFGEWDSTEYGRLRTCDCGYEEFELDYTVENINVSAPAGVYESDIVAVLLDVTDLIDEILGPGYLDQLYFDLSMYTFTAIKEEDLENPEASYIQPNGEIKVTVELGSEYSENTLVYFVGENDEEPILIDVTIVDGLMTFTIDEVGSFMFVDVPATTEGWNLINGKWYYFYSDGELCTDTFLSRGNAWYYFNEFGVMQTGFVEIRGSRYFFDSSGVMHTGWLSNGGAWYYFNSSGIMQTGWQWIDGTFYYFDNTGAMYTGWVQIGGIWYYYDSYGIAVTGWQQIGGSWYYFNSGCEMATGWVNDGGTWYYMNNSGAMATGWQLIGGTWYYFNSSGAMATGWVYDGAWYYMNSSGAMVTGWQVIGGAWYYFYDNGVMAANCYVGNYWINANGIWQ